MSQPILIGKTLPDNTDESKLIVKDGITFAFLRSFVTPNKETPVLEPVFNKRIQNLRPFVSIKMGDIAITDIPYEHIIDFEYSFGEKSNFATVKLTFFDQTIWFIEGLVRYTMNENRPLTFTFGWYVDDTTILLHESGNLRIEIRKLNYEFSSGGVYINIEGTPSATQALSSIFIKDKEFDPKGFVSGINSSELLSLYNLEDLKNVDSAKNLGKFAKNSQLQGQIKAWIVNTLIDCKKQVEGRIAQLTPSSGPISPALTKEMQDSKIQVTALTNQLKDLIDYDIIIDNSIQIGEGFGSLDPIKISGLHLLDAIKNIFKKLKIPNGGEVSIVVDPIKRGSYNGTIRIADPLYAQKDFSNTLHQENYKGIGIDGVFSIVEYPSIETSVISFAPTYNAWMLWFKGYRVAYPSTDKEAIGIPITNLEKIAKASAMAGNPELDKLVKAFQTSMATNTEGYVTNDTLDSRSGYNNKGGSSSTKPVLVSSEPVAANVTLNPLHDKDASFATAVLTILGEPHIDSVNWLWKRIGIIINQPDNDQYMASPNNVINYKLSSPEGEAFIGGPCFDKKASSPWNGVWIIRNVRHTISATQTFKTELELSKVE